MVNPLVRNWSFRTICITVVVVENKTKKYITSIWKANLWFFIDKKSERISLSRCLLQRSSQKIVTYSTRKKTDNVKMAGDLDINKIHHDINSQRHRGAPIYWSRKIFFSVFWKGTKRESYDKTRFSKGLGTFGLPWFMKIKQTLPKALRTQALTALTSNFGLVGLVQYAW